MTDEDDDERRSLDGLAKGFRKRTVVTAKVLAKIGYKAAKQGLGRGRVLTPKQEAKATQAAEALLAELDGLKGLMMKAGQMMSYLDATLPPEAQRILSKLQSQSSPVAFEQIVGVIEEDLGGEPEALFDDFEREPFAAASIGQVHRATLSGEPVAVKVQYPGIRALLSKDVKMIGRLSRAALLFSPVDGPGMVDELDARLQEECDYAAEADHQTRLREVFLAHPHIDVPRVYPERSGARVLCSEFVPRMGFAALRDGASQAVKNRAASLIYEACFSAIFRHCAYNADPHPGNYLFSEDGEVTLLDFGCMKKFSAEFIDRWKRLARSVIDDDRATFREAFTEAGFVGRPRRFDFDHQMEAMRFLYTPMISKEPFTFTHEFVREVNERLTMGNKNKLRMGMAPDWLFVNRLQFGLFSILAHLDATAVWSDLFRAAIESPTEPLYDTP